MTILCLLLTLTSFGQDEFDESKISKSTRQIVNDMKSKNAVESAFIDYVRMPSKQYENFKKLRETAKTKELKQLTNHPVEAVRCYAFWALWYDRSIDLYPIIVAHITDSASVATQSGCVISFEKVGDFFIDIANEPIDSNLTKRLSPLQIEQLDSILICTPNNLYARSIALKNVNPSAYFYAIIRDLVIRDENKMALVALAKYRKQEDIQLISRKLASDQSYEEHIYAYKAISEFPSSEFLPLLEENLKRQIEKMNVNECRQLYKTLVSYNNDKAIELIQRSLTIQNEDTRDDYIDFVFAAINESKDSIYDDLRWKLWADENRISPDVFKYLLVRNQDKTLELTKESLKKTNEIYMDNMHVNLYNVTGTKALIADMLELVERKDRSYAIEMVKENIEETNVHLFPIFAQKAAEIQEGSLIEPLFKRLETESNPHIYLEAAKALIAYKNSKINQRILETREKNVALTEGWGGQAFTQLLKNNGLL